MKRDIRYIYAIYSPAFPFRVKYGISEHPRRRASEIASKLSSIKNREVIVRVAMALPSFFSKAQEGKIHDTFRMFRADMPVHSGGTEWFWWANLGSCLALCLFVFIRFSVPFSWSDWLSTWLTMAVMSAVFYPVDAALVVLAVFLWEIKWIALFVFFAVNAAIIYF